MGWMDAFRQFFDTPERAAFRARQLNVTLDADLFMNLCKTLYAEAPKGSMLLVMEAVLPPPKRSPERSPERVTESAPKESPDTCKLECYAKKSTGKNSRYAPSLRAEAEICAWLHQLRQSMIDQKQPVWKGLKLTVDVPGDKYNADFKY